jgi:BlaI family transcriptional regulator, penicillinase repressor
MKKPKVILDIEWQIMGELWKKGVLSIKEVWQQLYPNGEKAYTTVQTYMDRMTEKKLLHKEKIGLVNFYRPLIDEKTLIKQATEKFVFNTFNGSFGSMAAFLVDSYNLSSEDMEKIKQLIKKKEVE